MRLKKHLTYLLFNLFIAFLNISRTQAQGTLTDYKRAEAVDSLFRDKVFNAPVSFHWIGDSLLWYVNNTSKGEEYLLVKPSQKEQKSAFDQVKLAVALSELLDTEVKPYTLKINDLKYNKDFSQITFSTDSLKITGNLDTYSVQVLEALDQKKQDNNGYWGNRDDEKSADPVPSPSGDFSAFIKNHNVYIQEKGTKKETQLSFDGSKGFYYSPHILWSPDSKKIMAYKLRPHEEHKVYFVKSSPEDQLQPELENRNYLKPGDQVDYKSPQVFIVATKENIEVPTALFDQQYSINNFKWLDDSSAFTFEYNQRGHQVYRVLSVNAENGEVRAIIDETSPTFIDYSGKKYRHDVEGKEEIIWASERDGWNHLYLYDSKTGTVKNQITKGDWPLREVLEVDDKNRQIYFTASGMDKGMDPYFIQYCRIDFDGKNFTRFTSENGNHKVTFSPDHRFYVDQYSRIDMPPVTLLKEYGKKKPVMELQKADISALNAEKWQMPEPFVAKGRDGKTDIYGMIVRPTNFDPNKKYPVIEYIYAGPQDSFVPKDFHPYYWSMTPMAELGFIMVQIDGMGTSNRSKAFHDVCWKNLKDAGFPDRKLWIKAAAKKYPYMDLDRVGIRGTSAGGQNAGAALVFNHDFYKVAVASCGCHDNRMDKMWWNEQWMGYPIGPQYAACSNTEHADQLEGDLLLMVGEVDDNVDPASTMQFADALIKAGKDFDLVVLPGMSHTSGGVFGERKRRDFFVQHLLHVNPPAWNTIYDQKMQ